MLACITGGTGFIGSYVVRALLNDGHQVRVLHRASSDTSLLDGLEYESVIGDVTDRDSLKAAFAGCDWVFHVAAVASYWRADEDWMFKVNVDGTKNVLDAAKEAHVKRVIFTSSAAAVGVRDGTQPADETAPFNLPRESFPYAYSKYESERLVGAAVTDGLDVVTVNPAVVIGAGDKNIISGSFILRAHQYQWTTPIPSGGLSVIDVKDVAAGHLAAAKVGRTGERYILTHENYSYREWFKLVADIIGAAKPFIPAPSALLPLASRSISAMRRIGIPTPVDPNQVLLGKRYVYFDNSKMREELHEPQTPMRLSIAETYQWYVDNGYIKDTKMTKVLQFLARK